jgi:hypothetical protein
MRRSLRSLPLLVAGVVATTVLVAPPASAATEIITDPAGDGFKGPRLDITLGSLANKDHALRVGVEFVKVASGDLIIFLQARGGGGVYRVVSELDQSGEDSAQSDYLLVPGSQSPVACPGLKVRWDDAKDVAVVRLPSRCLDDGDYGAVRFKVLTEIGSDADLMPDQTGPDGNVFPWSDWVARG